MIPVSQRLKAACVDDLNVLGKLVVDMSTDFSGSAPADAMEMPTDWKGPLGQYGRRMRRPYPWWYSFLMTATLTDRILGTGWPKPVYPDVRLGRIVFANAHEKVRQSIGIILETEPGERLMRPTFGCGLRRYLMKPNTTARVPKRAGSRLGSPTRTLIQLDVARALTTWEPRIELQSVRVEPGDDPALVLVDTHYLIRVDGSAQNLVYPFYLE